MPSQTAPRLFTPSALVSLWLLAACGGSEPHVARRDPAPPAGPATPLTLECTARPEADATPPADDEPHLGRVAEPENPRDLCAVADSTIARASAEILALPAPRQAPNAPRWDHKTSPRHLARLTERFGLGTDELAALRRDGFVVPDRLGANNYAFAYHEIHQSQLPLLVTLDSLFHAIYAGHEHMLSDLERRRLRPLLATLVDELHCALPAASARYPTETVHDLDVYLTVARRLLDGSDLATASKLPELEALATRLVAMARLADALETVTLFGRERVIDFTQLAPRGHYAGDEALASYFRAAMWLSRLELNLVSRSSRSSAPGTTPDPRETPREATLALALTDLAVTSGAMDELAQLDLAWSTFAGLREDVSPMALRELMSSPTPLDPRDPTAPEALRQRLGDRFQRTARTHYMPQGSQVLPAIFTLLGPRVVADAAATRPLVHSEVPDRYRLGGADFAWLLGHDRAKHHLARDLATFPALPAALDTARRLMDAGREAGRQRGDLYASWLDAIAALSLRPDPSVLPSYMATEAYADLRLNTAIAAYAQLRHNNVLMAASSYDEGGCEIPDGWVEASPEALAALIRYAERGAAATATLDPGAHGAKTRAYFERLARVLGVLARIVDHQLAGAPLPEPMRRFLAQVVELSPGSTGGPPTYTGWYFDLFERREADGLKDADLIADVYTSVNAGVSYLGISEPRFGLFVIDRGGPPRVMVGPVATAWQHLGGLDQRLNDDTAKALPAAAREAPWAASYLIAAPPEPDLAIAYEHNFDPDQPASKAHVMRVTAKQDLGPVTLTLLDHHREPVRSLTKQVGPGETAFSFALRSKDPWQPGFEAVAVRVGSFHAMMEVAEICSCGSLDLGSFRTPSEAPAEPTEAP